MSTTLDMPYTELDTQLTRHEVTQGNLSHVDRVTYSWHAMRVVDAAGATRVKYRAVVHYWGRWDVAFTWHYDAWHPRELYHELCRRGVLKCKSEDGAAYRVWHDMGEVK